MCGFVVAFAKGLAAPVQPSKLDAMDLALAHRGPDEYGARNIGPVAIRHRRLSIIDLGGGKQPMASADGRLWLAHNGEIYNYRELRRELEVLGHVFHEQSDTAVLLAAWQEWGEACLDRLDGMFALVVYDARRGTLKAARDRFGEKPLYYIETPQTLWLASELKALVAGGVVEKRLDPLALYSYFTLGYVAGEQSIFSGVRRLAPGQVLTFSVETGLKTRKWWRPPAPAEELDDIDEITSRSLSILRESVALRMVADVPLGFFLSGGVDSSAIVALAAETGAGRLETFSIGFDDPALDERPHARFVAERFGTRHHEFVVTPQNLDTLDAIAWHADEPFADQAALPTWFLAQMTRRHVTVALSGDGGDEIFAGYDVYRSHGLSERVRAVPSPIRQLVAAGLRAGAPFGDGRLRLKLARNIEDAGLPAAERFIAKQQTVFRGEFLRGIAPALCAAAAGADADRELFAPLFGQAANPLGAIALWQQSVSLPDDMLHKVDRMSMAHSLEVRAPFLDHRLAELLNRTKFSAKLPGGRQKYILRRAMAAYFPAEFLDRRKQGFVMPLQRWFRGDLTRHLRSVVAAPDSASAGVIPRPTIERILAEHERGARAWDGALWALLIFEHWCRRFGLTAGSLADAA
ncbi:MAG TPA: asparagine synthase (glutamine-hydrolyzing) [Rhizomicrobium sp.]|jgi:asparagine synthase (glutamine-hydrolysing)|nr:asparagine synthase (glutamine-hydrolyzing) [Rhizomicrobium sp.]